MSKAPKAAVRTARNRQRREKTTVPQASAGDAAELIAAYRLAYGPHTPDREAFQRILDETTAADRKAFDDISKKTKVQLSAEAASDQDRLFAVFDDCMGRAYELTFWQRFKKPRLDAVTKAEARTTRAFEALIATLNELLPPDTYETRCIAEDIERIELGLSNIRFTVDRHLQSYVTSSEDHEGADTKGDSDFHRAVLAILGGFYELAFAPSTVPADPGAGPFFRFVDACYSEMHAVIQKLQPSERAGQKAVDVKKDALKKWARKNSSTMRARLETPLEERKAMLDFRQRSPAAASHHTIWDLAALRWRRRSDPANKRRKISEDCG
jgi:hypothetical protein